MKKIITTILIVVLVFTMCSTALATGKKVTAGIKSGSLGASITAYQSVTNAPTYFGATTNVGFGTPGGEFHVEWEAKYVVYSDRS